MLGRVVIKKVVWRVIDLDFYFVFKFKINKRRLVFYIKGRKLGLF